MPRLQSEDVVIQHRFTYTLDDGTMYTDALVLPENEYRGLAKAEIAKQRLARVQAHVKRLQEPPPSPEPPSESDLLNQRSELLRQISDLDQRLAEMKR